MVLIFIPRYKYTLWQIELPMNFSDVFKYSNYLAKFSSNGNYLANALQHRLIIRNTSSLEIHQIFSNTDSIQDIEWSPDSTLIICALYKRSTLQVWSIEDPSWFCKIDEGTAGLIQFSWSPDSRHILTSSEHYLRITVWSLSNKSVSYIKYPKAVEGNFDFSKDGKFLALLERRDCKDYIAIFDCKSWHLLKHFESDTKDAAGLSWSPESQVIAVWESALETGNSINGNLTNDFRNMLTYFDELLYKIVLYSVDGHHLSSYTAYQWALGIKSIAWSPSSQFLAIGSYDQKVRILNSVIWQPVAEHCHSPSSIKHKTALYQETEKPLVNQGIHFGPRRTSKYEVVLDHPLTIPCLKSDVAKANPKMGIGYVCFSHDNRFLATRNDNMPSALWIWSMEELFLVACLLQIQSIKCIQWDPTRPRLALCTGTNKIYLWSTEGSTTVEVPVQVTFDVLSLRWHSTGEFILLLGKDHTCFCYL